jgi:hypothetical protein
MPVVGEANDDYAKFVRLSPPPLRRLRVYAFDPSLETQLDTAVLNRVTLSVPWECDRQSGEPLLSPGPVGDYLEVVDYDPASDCFYPPVDLDHPYILAQEGLDPSEGNPQFHQQMVYAVAMTTIGNFERALGRLALWGPRRARAADAGAESLEIEVFVRRLRVYPHALRHPNAYYSPPKKALLFGYFPAAPADPGKHLPGGTVFTCLSHDIIAHETTHALLDGMHRHFIEPSNPDVRAFHEAFADLVALFQHFSYPEVLRHQIAKTRGDLASQNLLGQLAQQFGQATGRYGALRDALGREDPETGKWQPLPADPTQIDREFQPHARGAILVAAVFDAFLTIYRARIADLLRLATGGSGVLPQGALQPDLVNRLAREASTSAQHLLTMCIRALDYCPPVDITFGEYLRALITADYDLVRDDDRGYRLAVIEAFRRRGIYPRDVRSLSEDTLRWKGPDAPAQVALRKGLDVLRLQEIARGWDMNCDRLEAWNQMLAARVEVRNWLLQMQNAPDLAPLAGLTVKPYGSPIDVQAVRPTRRLGPDGQSIIEMVIEIGQHRAGYFSEQTQQMADAGNEVEHAPDFRFRGGCSLLLDLETGNVRYAVIKNIDSEARLRRQRRFMSGGAGKPSLHATYFGDPGGREEREPFAFLHRSLDEEAWE